MIIPVAVYEQLFGGGMLQSDGEGGYQFTPMALLQAPSNSGATPEEVWEYDNRTLTSGESGEVSVEELLEATEPPH